MLPTLRRAALGVPLFQTGAWLLIAVFGFAKSLPSSFLALTQMPGVFLLSEIGWCCGVGGGFVLSGVILKASNRLSSRPFSVNIHPLGMPFASRD